MRFFLVLFIFAAFVPIPAPCRTNVISARNDFGGRTLSRVFLFQDPEFQVLHTARILTWLDARGTNRLKVVFRTPDYVDETGDFKETSAFDTNGRLVFFEVSRTNGDENRDCYFRRTYRYDSQPFSWMTEIVLTPACQTEEMYSVRREFTDPAGKTNQTWLCYTEEFRRGTGRKYLVTTWSADHRRDDLAVVYSNDNFLSTGFSRVVEHYDPYEVLYLREYVVDPGRTNASAYAAVRKFLDRHGRLERQEYLFTQKEERASGLRRAVIECDENAAWTRLTAYNSRGYALLRRYGAEKIREWLKSRSLE